MQAHDQPAQRGFAAARLAHQPDHLAGGNIEIDMVDGMHHLFPQARAEPVGDARREVQPFDEALGHAPQRQDRHPQPGLGGRRLDGHGGIVFGMRRAHAAVSSGRWVTG